MVQEDIEKLEVWGTMVVTEAWEAWGLWVWEAWEEIWFECTKDTILLILI